MFASESALTYIALWCWSNKVSPLGVQQSNGYKCITPTCNRQDLYTSTHMYSIAHNSKMLLLLTATIARYNLSFPVFALLIVSHLKKFFLQIIKLSYWSKMPTLCSIYGITTWLCQCFILVNFHFTFTNNSSNIILITRRGWFAKAAVQQWWGWTIATQGTQQHWPAIVNSKIGVDTCGNSCHQWTRGSSLASTQV